MRDALARVLRALLGEQRDPAGRVGERPDEHRVPARARRRARACTTCYKDVVRTSRAQAYERIGKDPPEAR